MRHQFINLNLTGDRTSTENGNACIRWFSSIDCVCVRVCACAWSKKTIEDHANEKCWDRKDGEPVISIVALLSRVRELVRSGHS